MYPIKESENKRKALEVLNFWVPDEEKKDLIPFLDATVDLVYGGLDYARSVLGTNKITRSLIIDYFDHAQATWPKTTMPKDASRAVVKTWCKELGIKPLHYYSTMHNRYIWFKEEQDSFAFKLKFGL